MRRRRLLAFVPALLAGPLSGCFSPTAADGPGTAATPDPLPPPGDGTLSEFDAGDPFETRRVGASAEESHHRAAVWNDDAERREIGIRLRSAATGDPVVDAAAEFPAYGTLRIEIFRPRDYVLDVSPPGAAGRTLGIRREFVDCNDSATHVAVRPDSTVRAQVISTAPDCGARSEGVPSPSGSVPSTASGTTEE